MEKLKEGHEIKLLDHGYCKFIESWGSDERVIEAARMSTDKGFLGWGTSEKPGDEKLLSYLWNHKHASPFEFAGLVIEIQCPIFVEREMIRHRVLSTNELSGRYTAIPNINYIPSVERLMLNANGTNKQAGTIKGADTLTVGKAESFCTVLVDHYAQGEELYQAALKAGIPKELARVHIPVGRYTRVRHQANLRNWLGILTLRDATDAQWEIQQYAKAIGSFIANEFPRTWELFAKTHKGA